MESASGAIAEMKTGTAEGCARSAVLADGKISGF